MQNTQIEMRVYVGTYARYNSGSLFGAWLNIADYSDKEEFITACKALHHLEADPELMFQDWEGIPKGLITECDIDDIVFEMAQMSDDDLELLTVYQEHITAEGSLEQAQEAFRGKYDRKTDYVDEFLEDTGALDSVPEWLKSHIDSESIARDWELGGDTSFVYHDGMYWVFSN